MGREPGAGLMQELEGRAEAVAGTFIAQNVVDESEGEDGRGPEGSDFAAEEGYEEDVRGPEESDFAAEEGYEEGGPDAEGGHEEVWDEVQEALSAMEHEEFDDTSEADCARSQASRPSSAASSQASVRS